MEKLFSETQEFKLKLEQLNAISSRMIDASFNVLIVIFLFTVAKLGLGATDD